MDRMMGKIKKLEEQMALMCSVVVQGSMAGTSFALGAPTTRRFQGVEIQFSPDNAAKEARAKLRRLTQKGTISDYVKEFFEILLEISNYPDEEALFAFMDDFQHWLKMEIEHRGAQVLAIVISIAESLVEYKKGDKDEDDEDYELVQSADDDEDDDEDDDGEGGDDDDDDEEEDSDEDEDGEEEFGSRHPALRLHRRNGSHARRDSDDKRNFKYYQPT
ncbi:acidic leucine-rich nuclear phosphoprotein 32 family member B-like [Manihot esculenta]|uniref:acidic leucine-rich nuclear phosphoprotein 32 family member B-like n=1 Tax=Manihot esculenta TaxID=3983 RepID=UPI001CC54EAC|nr:acidic leucine-rich nuclear phosphoprotein 32 family member B-like [Manihot esculenta]